MLYLHDLSAYIPWEWICSHLNLYADDFQVWGLFHNLSELNELMRNFGIIMELLQRKGLIINTNKSAVLLTMSGTSCRPHRSKLTWRDQKGEWIQIQGPTTAFELPVVASTKYLGVMISYAHMEQDTMRYRLRLARLAFSRLRKWLTARRGLATAARLQLWKTCILPVVSYGIFTLGVTKAGLQLFQTAIFSMLRQILHDHAYITGHSHAHILQHPLIQHPLVLLGRAAEALHTSLTQCTNLHPADILHTFDWTQLRETLSFISAEYAAGTVFPGDLMAEEEAHQTQSMQCPYCEFVTTYVSVLRRHCTQTHGLTQYRKCIRHISRHMTNGLPQCKHCHMSFTTWRSFKIHVQRGCQVLTYAERIERPLHEPDLLAVPSLEAVPELTTGLLPKSALVTLRAHEFGPRLLTLIQNKQWHLIPEERAGCIYLSKHCLLCGQFVGRASAMHHHFKTVHQIAGPGVLAKSVQLTNLHSAESPCSACGVIFYRSHSCNVWFQVSMIALHAADAQQAPDTQQTNALLCEICGVRCTSAALLHTHLQEVHGLTSADWHEARDSVDGQPICAHCGTRFQTIAGVRSHVLQGRCRSFDPDKPTETTPVQDRWLRALCHGELEELLRDPQARLQLTLRCQCCSKRYTRAMDLAAHLQGAHAVIWHNAQTLAHLFVQGQYGLRGCICNPSCNTNRVQHVCMPYLQLAMQFQRIPKAILMPNGITHTDIGRILPQHLAADLRQQLEQALLSFDLTSVWTDALLLDDLSTNCLFCGDTFLQTELCYHLQEAHHGMTATVQMYLDQLMPHALAFSDNDCACFACGQVFNLPAHSKPAPDDPIRQRLVQAHLRTHCPSVLHIALVLTWTHHGNPRMADGLSRRRCAANAPDLPQFSSTLGQNAAAGTKSRGYQEDSSGPAAKRPRQTRPRPRRSHSGGADHLATDGKVAPAHGPGHAGPQSRAHVPVVLQLQRTNRCSDTTGSEGRGMAQTGPTEYITIEDDTAETSPFASHHQRNDDTTPATGGSGGHLRPETGCLEEPCSAAGPDNPFHGMEWTSKVSPAVSTHTGECGEDGPTSPGAPGHVQGCGLDPEISCPTSEAAQRSGTMAAPAVAPGRSLLRAAPTLVSVSNMDNSWSKSQASCTA